MLGLLQTTKRFVSPARIEVSFAVKYAGPARNTPSIWGKYRRPSATTTGPIQAGCLLEAGPGPGLIAIEIAWLLLKVQVIEPDLSKARIEIATRNAGEHGVSRRAVFRDDDASKMRFGEASFDFIDFCGSLRHWKEPSVIFSEMQRVPKAHCRALISNLRSDAPKAEV